MEVSKDHEESADDLFPCVTAGSDNGQEQIKHHNFHGLRRIVMAVGDDMGLRRDRAQPKFVERSHYVGVVVFDRQDHDGSVNKAASHRADDVTKAFSRSWRSRVWVQHPSQFFAVDVFKCRHLFRGPLFDFLAGGSGLGEDVDTDEQDQRREYQFHGAPPQTEHPECQQNRA
jgi:hypothetical protein